MPTPMTKTEALREIARLQAMVEGLPDEPKPKNNHPPKYQAGQLYLCKPSGRIYLYMQGGNLVCVSSNDEGWVFSPRGFFGYEDSFEYLGLAKDILTIKADPKPEDEPVRGWSSLPAVIHELVRNRNWVLQEPVMWAAQDSAGVWRGFVNRPVCGERGWLSDGQVECFGCHANAVDWTKTLTDLTKP